MNVVPSTSRRSIQCSQEPHQRKWCYNHPCLTFDQTRYRENRKLFTRFHSFVRLSNSPLYICTTLSFVEIWLDLETVIESEVSQKVKTNIVYETNIAYMWNIEKWYRWSYLQNRNRDRDVENKHMDTKGGRGGWHELGDWDWHKIGN